MCEEINFFVGNNNCEKTTIFKAIEFIQKGKNKEGFITKGKEISRKRFIMPYELSKFFNSLDMIG